MIERRRPVRGAESKSKSKPATAAEWTPFGERPLIQGEDAAVYDELLGRLWAAVKPLDVIEELYVSDLADLQWEVWRWRRLKTSLIQEHALRSLKNFLEVELDDEVCSDYFVDLLETTLLQHNYPEDEARKLAQRCDRNESDAVEEAETFLRRLPETLSNIYDRARRDKAADLLREFLTKEPDAVMKVRELLAAAGKSMDDMSVDALENPDFMDAIERIDRLTAIAETRRNDSLHEIERLRTPLGQAMRRSVQEIEDANLPLIEPPAKAKKIA